MDQDRSIGGTRILQSRGSHGMNGNFPNQFEKGGLRNGSPLVEFRGKKSG